MKALLKNYHQSPQKVRLVANLIRGKSVPAARAALSFLPKKSAPAVAKLLDSAIANAGTENVRIEDLFVKTITVDKGAVMRRSRPFGRGRAGLIRKTMSIIRLRTRRTSFKSKVESCKQEVKSNSKILILLTCNFQKLI
jgi:large subunit ribosomal protein L22